MAEHENFFTDFQKPGYEAWKEAAIKALKGKPFEKIFKNTYEDITLKPIYNQEDTASLAHMKAQHPGFYPYVRNTSASPEPWQVVQEITYGDPEDFNHAALFDMPRGLDGLIISLHDASLSENYDINDTGLILKNLDCLRNSLENINITDKYIYFIPKNDIAVIAGLIEAYCKVEEIPPDQLKGGILADPISTLLKKGYSEISYNQQLTHISEILNIFPDGYKTINIDASVIANSGGSAIDEIAYAISIGVEYIRQLQLKSSDINKITSSMLFTFSVGSNFFMEIAKLRAARMLWAKVTKEFGADLENQKMFIHAKTAKINKTKFDPYVNLLRHTSEALSAIVSGCDMLTIGYFDLAHRQPNEFSRRVSRNLQHILKHESHLLATVDPGGGSYYIESITADAAKLAWQQFTEYESLGGIFKAIQNGTLQSKLNETLAARQKNLSTRKDTILGSNKFINSNDIDIKSDVDYEQKNNELISEIKSVESKQESIKQRLSKSVGAVEMIADEIMSGTTLIDCAKALYDEKEAVDPIKDIRLAQIFENLRQPIENYKITNNEYPKVLLINYGKPSNFKARADFSADFFQVGGFEVISSKGFNSYEDAAKKAIENDFPVAVICSSDDKYPEFVPQLVRLIKRAKPLMQIVLAGYPKDHIEAFKDAGVNDFIHIKSNILAFHENLQQELNIKK